MEEILERKVRPGTVPGEAEIYRRIVQLAVEGCAGWAHTAYGPELSVLLWPRDRGPSGSRPPYRVGVLTAARGVARIALRPARDLPAGVDPAVRDALSLALAALDGAELTAAHADQIVQTGLFGEVFYPCD